MKRKKKAGSRLGPLILDGKTPRIAVVFSGKVTRADAAKARKAGADIIEARIDLFADKKPENIVRRLRQLRRLPVIGTIRIEKEGGGWKESEVARRDLFRAILPYVDAVDIELTARGTLHEIAHLAKKRKKLVIVSHHDFEKTPNLAALKKTVRAAEAAGADIVKISTHAAKMKDTDTLATLLIEHKRRNLVVIGMGEKGLITRLLFPGFGSLFTFASWRERKSAPGQIPLAHMAGLLRG